MAIQNHFDDAPSQSMRLQRIMELVTKQAFIMQTLLSTTAQMTDSSSIGENSRVHLRAMLERVWGGAGVGVQGALCNIDLKGGVVRVAFSI